MMMMFIPIPLKKGGCCNDLSPTSYDISDKSNIVQRYKEEESVGLFEAVYQFRLELHCKK